jgi:hypothetical protein
LTTYKCQAPKCSNQIEIGFWCNDCEKGFLEDIMLMDTPPSFFWRVYDFISTKIDKFMFGLEYIHDKKIYRKKRGERIS